MEKNINIGQQNRSALFDWLVFVISLSLGFIFPTLKQFAASNQFSYWMLAALLFYTVGAWLKHQPLYYRLFTARKQTKKFSWILFIILGHWIIFMMVEQFAEPAFRYIFNLSEIDPKRSEGETVLVSGLVATFVTWLVFRSGGKSIAKKKLTAIYVFRREIIADLLLVVGVSILSFLFWEKGVMSFLSTKPNATIKDIWLSFGMLCIAYVLFYMPLRYLFLIEDHSDHKTWKRLLIIFGLLLLKALFEMLNL
jgi:hypothetical protein